MESPAGTRVARAFLDQLLNRSSLGELLEDEVVFQVAGVGVMGRGREAVEAGFHHHYEVEFDTRPEVVNIFGDGDSAIAEIVFAGRHIGTYKGIEATGRDVRLPMAMIFEITNSRIETIRVYRSLDQILHQLEA